MIDTHLHLDQYDRKALRKLLSEWQEQGVAGVVAVATDLRSSYETLELNIQFPDFVFPCIGWHPEQRLPTAGERNELFDLITSEQAHLVGIGEIGLPHYALETLGSPSLAPYVELLEAFLEQASELELPVNLHAIYDGATTAVQLLRQYAVKKAHFHWLKADLQTVGEIVESQYYISFTPELCYRERDRILLQQIPLTQLLVETDGPWSFSGPFINEETTPVLIEHVLQKIATEKGRSFSDVRKQIYQNTVHLYKSRTMHTHLE